MRSAFVNSNAFQRFFVIFYIIGLTGLLLPFTFSLFIYLIPWSLLLNIFCLALFHEGPRDFRTLFVFLVICISSLAVEIAGVNTSCIFGPYTYGEGLGIKIFNAPIIIGLNWLFLTYTSASVLEKIKMPASVKIVTGSAIMIVYDIVLEKAAPLLDMWKWENGAVPLRNYFVWGLLAIVFHTLIKLSGINTRNSLSPVILVSQFIFLTVLAIFLK
ncbi:MAG TPA: carotenoid biosynthesis protein [Bacteroidales bacterium]|nr:carotenoid biosynthesis protein [Bacteroidales bacterium]HPT12084.1 carotenoid biosynthesis protein [Bacteroidales bacterium]